jgi:hypothetical protein
VSSTYIENTRHAIELMTAWLEDPEEPSEMFLARLSSLIRGRSEGDLLPGTVELVMGMTQLCGGLLITLAEETGMSEGETLRRLALAYAMED